MTMSFLDTSRLIGDGPRDRDGPDEDNDKNNNSIWRPTARGLAPPFGLQQSGDRSAHRPAAALAREQQQLRRNEQFTLAQGQLWQIESGFMRMLTWDDQGLISVLGLWGPGDCFALPFSGVQPCQFDCLRPAKLRRLPLHQGYPYEFLCTQVQRLEELLCLTRVRALDARVLKTLRWLARRFGKPERGVWQVGVPLTHQELAELVGSTRVSITRILQELQRSGQLRCDGRQWFLPSQPGDR